MRDSGDNYGEMMTEYSNQDHGRMTPSWDWIRGWLGALPTEGTDRDVYLTAYRIECWTTILEAYKPAWRMLMEDIYNYWWVPRESYRLQERISDIKAGPQSYARGSGERKRAWIYMVWMTIWWEAYKIDMRSYMIDHHQRLWYRMQKPPKQPQWSLMGWAHGIVNEKLGELEC